MKTLIVPIRFILLLLAIFVWLPSNAKDIVYTGFKNKADLTASTVIQVIDPQYLEPGEGVNYVRKYTAIPRLVYNRSLKTDVAGNVWSYKIEYDLLYSDLVVGQSVVKAGTLFIEHNNTEGIYEAIGIHEEVVGDVKIRVKTITPIGNVPNDIHLELQLKVERYDYLDETDPIAKNEMVLVSNVYNQAEIAWKQVDGAEYYELEWVYWDALYNTQTTNLASIDLETIFKKAVKIETKATSYQFDLFYPSGYIFVRVRPVGRYIRGVSGNYDYLKYGRWEQGVDPISNSFGIIISSGFESGRIWQVQRSFAEDAKNKQVIQYFDEGMKGRQTLTNLSSDDLTIVGENVYDAEGRPSLSILPVPVKSLIGKNPLQFGGGTLGGTEGGLISTDAIDYTHKDFDKTSNADPLTKVNGQGKKHVSTIYYSSENPFNNHIHRDYIPDAENFPITQTKFLNDATGRIASQSGVGAFYQLGSNHETKYFYSNPTHVELRRLFGKNVGDEIHYRKNYVVDANGQISVSYIDQAGQTIATALAGKSPDNVHELSSESSATDTIKSSIMGRNIIDQAEKISTLSHLIFCDEAPRIDKFTYTLKGDGLYLPDPTNSICVGCEYQVNISLIDGNGTTIPLVLNTATNGNQNHNGITTQVINGEIIVDYNSLHLNTCVPIPTVDIDFEATLSNVGSYTLKKVLKVIEPDPNKLITHLKNNGDLKDKQTFINQYITANWDPNECDDCNDTIRLKLCEDIVKAEQGIVDIFGQRYYDRVNYYYFNTVTYQNCDDLRKILALETALETTCKAKLELMEQQIAPAGDPSTGSQGCLYGELDFWEHVYTTNNPFTIESHDTINGDTIYNTFYSSSQFTNFIQNQANWQDHFVEHPNIIKQHPEYCAYQEYCKNEITLLSKRFDFELAELTSWADAIAFGANLQTPINLTVGDYTKIMDMDPFFATNPIAYAQMNARLSSYCTSEYSNSGTPHPSNTNGCGGGCSDVICYINNILGDPAQYDSINYVGLPSPYNLTNIADITPLSNEDKWRFFRGIYAAEKAKAQQNYLESILSCSGANPYTGTSSCEPIIDADDTQDFMDDNGGGSPSNLSDVQSVADSVNQNNCAAICLGNAQRWVGQLCPDMDKSAPEYQQLINHFVAFCTGECSAVGTDNPMGYIFNDDINPMDSDLAQAQIILTTHTDCGQGLVANTSPSPSINVVFANKTDVYEWTNDYSTSGGLNQECEDDLACIFDRLKQSNLFPTKYIDATAGCPNSSQLSFVNPTTLGGYYFNYNFPATTGLACNGYTNLDLVNADITPWNYGLLCGGNISTAYYLRFHTGTFSQNDLMLVLKDPQTGHLINPLIIKSVDNYNALAKTLTITIKDACTWNLPSYINPNSSASQSINCADIPANCIGGFRQINAQVEIISSWGEFGQVSNRCTSCQGRWTLKKNQLTINLDSVKVQCEEQQRAELTRKATEAYDKYLEDKLTELTGGTPCMAFAETMIAEYTTTEHHYTLYYYDQAGNLIQTIPPAAVTPLSVAHFSPTTGVWDGTDPSHDYEMTTTYQYNTLGQVVEQESPDGGLSKFWYDYAQRLRFSQNARQATNGRYAYTKFDAQGRTIEVGRLDGHGLLSNWDLNKTTFPETTLSLHEQIITEYEEASFSPIVQDNLRGRVARTYNDHIATYYDYDVHGNVKKIHHQIGEFGASEIEYDYDLITGNVKEVAFMKGTEEQFFHRYGYDADNRITETQTSRNGYIWELDARYFYYAHGPLARIELGEDKVQGLDYMYNLQGWIKGVNNTTSERDLGKDGFIPSGVGSIHNMNKWIGQDQMAYYLGYHREDYKPIGMGTNLGVFEHSNTAVFNADIKGNSSVEGLYNGNIAFMISHIPTLASANPLTKATQAMVYEYDALHRITKSESYAYTNGWSKSGLSNAYRTSYSYDGNGNIEKLNRYALNTPTNASKHIDDLTYQYGTGKHKNRLVAISDAQSTTTGLNDVGGANYTYDLIGNLKTDGTNTIEWNLQNKVSTVSNTDYDIVYTYDVSGNRLSKLVTPKGPSNSPNKTTFYIRDASGNIMGTYIVENDNGGFKKKLEETPIYGSSRLGIYQYDVSLGAFTPPTSIAPKVMNTILGTTLGADRMSNVTRGEKVFEMSNHLGNVLATVSDLKLGYLTAIGQTTAQGYKAQVQSAQDYYAFGWEMPGRKFNSQNYRFGFNGMEKNTELEGSYTTEYRQLDTRIGRWTSVDPAAHLYYSWSPYNLSMNSPLANSDPSGATATPVMKERLDAYELFLNSEIDRITNEIPKQQKKIDTYASTKHLPNYEERLAYNKEKLAGLREALPILKNRKSDIQAIRDSKYGFHFRHEEITTPLLQGLVEYDSKYKRIDMVLEDRDNWSTFGHELRHLVQFLEGKNSFKRSNSNKRYFSGGALYDLQDEIEAYQIGNSIGYNGGPMDYKEEAIGFYGKRLPALKNGNNITLESDAYNTVYEKVGIHFPTNKGKSMKDVLIRSNNYEISKGNGIQHIFFGGGL